MRFAPALLLAAGTAAVGCSSGGEPHGSPVLLGVYWITGAQPTLVWNGADGGVVTAPPAAQEVDFVFDRLLDGSRVENTIMENGIQVPMSKAMPPITVSWPDFATAMSAPPFSDQVFYNSEPFPLSGGATAYVLLQPTLPGFPSNDTITFTLDKTGLTSAYGDQMTGPSQISVMTAPLSVSFRLPSGEAAVPSNYMLPIVFSNRVAGASAIAPFVTVTAGGAALPVSFAASAADQTVIDVAPPSCLGEWPAGTPISVTVATGAPDAFGGPLAAAASATFTSIGGPSPDAGCPSADGGTD